MRVGEVEVRPERRAKWTKAQTRQAAHLLDGPLKGLEPPERRLSVKLEGGGPVLWHQAVSQEDEDVAEQPPISVDDDDLVFS